jgi:hypothetical protein
MSESVPRWFSPSPGLLSFPRIRLNLKVVKSIFIVDNPMDKQACQWRKSFEVEQMQPW